MDRSPLQTKSLSEQVYDYLTTQIIEGTLEYGMNLSVKEIASSLGISTMPVREAIKRLETEGVVSIYPRSRCLLRTPTKKSILEAAEMRETIECYCVRRVLSMSVEPDVGGLQELLRLMGEVVGQGTESGPVGRYIRLDRLYHSELCRLSGNHYAEKFHRELNLHLNMTFIYGLGVPPDLVETYEQHRRISDHIARREEAAVLLLEEHLALSRRNIEHGALFASLPSG